MIVMKFILFAMFFAQTLFSFEVTELKTDFHDKKFYLTFKIDEKTPVIITCEDEMIDIVLGEGEYDIRRFDFRKRWTKSQKYI